MIRLRAFARLSRLEFLAGGFASGALGTALAAYLRGAPIDWRAYGLAQATITSFHLMTHYANDYFDRHGDARATRTPHSGGSGALVDGSLEPWVGLAAAGATAALGCALVATLAATGHPAAAACGVGIAALAWAYSAPPIRLLARGLGEVATVLVVAVLVPLCAYGAQHGPADVRAFTSLLPGAAAIFAMMLAVELPDAAADAASGKRNLVVRLGARARTLGIVAVGAVVAALGIALASGAPPGFVLFVALAAPMGAGLARAFARTTRDGSGDAELAARGVGFFFVVTLFGALAYAAAPHGPSPAATLGRPSAVSRA